MSSARVFIAGKTPEPFARTEMERGAAQAAPPDGPRYTTFEMRGRNVRKILRALVRHRVSAGVAVGSPASWTMVAADLAAALRGPNITVYDVVTVCAWIGVSADMSIVAAAAAKAARERREPDFQMLAPKVIGAMLQISGTEWAEVRRTLRMRRMYVAPADGRSARRLQDREGAARRREAGGAQPRARSKAQTRPWEALGMSRSAFYSQGLHRATWTDSSLLPIRRVTATNSSKLPGNSDEIVQNEKPILGVPHPLMGNSDEFVQPPATATNSSSLRRTR